MRRNQKLNISLFLFTSLVPVAVFAQAIPSGVQPGRVQQQLQFEDQRPAVGGASIITVPDEAGKDKGLKGGATFKLKGVVVESATAFSKEELAAVYSGYIGKEATLGTLNEIASKITAKYRNAGYILSRAVVPPQRIGDGVAKIKIVEGYVNKVIVQGPGSDAKLIGQYAEKIRAAKPLNASTLERYLLLMDDLPGVSANAVLKPSSAPGASDVIITLKDKRIDGAVTVDNRGTRYLGPVQYGLEAHINNATGWYDHTLLRTNVTSIVRELQFFQLVHEEQLDSEGTKLTVGVGHTRTKPGYRLDTLRVSGVDVSYFAQVSHPFVRSRQTNWFGNVEVDHRRTKSMSLGAPLYTDRLNIARIGSTYDFVDSYSAINRFEGRLSKGLNFGDDGYPDIRSRSNGHTGFYKINGSASRLQPISGPFSLYVAATGQASSAALLSSEQFGVGGANFGSAYDPSEITGDSGIAGRTELQYSRYGDLEWVPSYQLYGFYDIGEVWVRNPAAGLERTESIASLGLGLRFNILDPISGNLEVAVPMTKDVAANSPNNGDDARVFFSLAYRY